MNPATRERIALAVGQLGYHGNMAARMLAAGRSKAIGVLAPQADDFGPTSTIHALEFAARERGYRLIVTSCLDSAESIAESLSLLRQQVVEAIVVVAPSAQAAESLAAFSSCPILPLQDGGSPGVFVDQAAGIAMGLGHLLDLGHRRIQELQGPEHSVEARQRHAAFERFLASHGLHASGAAMSGDWSARSGHAAAARVDADASAVCCANDQMALGLISGLRERGVRVPEDISVVGFDDVPEAAYFSPPLTTVRQDFSLLGRIAVERLDGLLRGEPAEALAIAPELVVRRTTQRARAA